MLRGANDTGEPGATLARSRGSEPQLHLLETPDLITEPRRLLELEIAGLAQHFDFEFLDLPHDGFRSEIQRRVRLAAGPALLAVTRQP